MDTITKLTTLDFSSIFISVFIINHKVIFDYLFKSSYMPV